MYKDPNTDIMLLTLEIHIYRLLSAIKTNKKFASVMVIPVMTVASHPSLVTPSHVYLQSRLNPNTF